MLVRKVPVRALSLKDGEAIVTTVFDLLAANYGLDRGFGGGNVAASFDDDVPYTPAWQEKITGVPRGHVITVAREFARNAEKTRGKSMVILGAGLNHWYHMDMNYRGIINLLVMCGCIGQSGGGWSHYVGQEKLRPQTGWTAARLRARLVRGRRGSMNSTSYWYAHTDQWRYETLGVDEILSPTAPDGHWGGPDRLQRARRTHGLAALGAAAAGQSARHCRAKPQPPGRGPKDYVATRLKTRRTASLPARIRTIRRTCRATCSSGARTCSARAARATNISSSICSAPRTACRARISARKAAPSRRRSSGTSDAPEGKLDLLVTLDFRMSTTCVYSDIVLPTATWYEKNDLNTSDMHPFIHPLTSAVDPVWESRSDWEIYKGIARAFSEVAPEVLGVEKDVVLTPIMHDTPGELAQPFDVKDWKRGEVEPIPGKTMAQVTVVERDYPNVYRRFTALGPLMTKLGNGGKGINWKTEVEVENLRRLNGTVAEPGATQGHAAHRDRHRRGRGDSDAGAGDQRRGCGQGLGGARQDDGSRACASCAAEGGREDPLPRRRRRSRARSSRRRPGRASNPSRSATTPATPTCTS